MEWVTVEYPDDRDVFVDGTELGETNRKLIVGQGSHDFDLGLPHDYTPLAQTVDVQGTTEEFPMVIKFEQVA